MTITRHLVCRRNQPVMKWRTGCLLLLLWTLIAPAVSLAGGGSVDGSGNIELNFHFRFVPTAADIATVQEQLRRSSEMLCDTTEGGVRISKVRLSAGGASEPAGDFWYYPEGAHSRSGNNGAPVHNDANRIFLTYDAIRADIVAHELGHLVLGLGDQYDEQRRFGGPCGIGRSFEIGAMDERNHTLMQQASYQQCQDSVGNFTGRGCLDATDCPVGETCPLSPLMSELSVASNFDLKRGDSVLPVNTCPSPQSGDTLEIRGALSAAEPVVAFDGTDFTTAAATAGGARMVEFVDDLGVFSIVGEGSSLPLTIFAEHTGPQAWTFHVGVDAGRLVGGVDGDLSIIDQIDLTFDASGELDTVDGVDITDPSYTDPTVSITGLTTGASDGTLSVEFETTGNGRLRELSGAVRSPLRGTMVTVGGFQQLGICGEVEACEKRWDTTTQRWEASAVTVGYLRRNETPLSDWEQLVRNFDAWYPVSLTLPAALPVAASPGCGSARNIDFDVQISGADQIMLIVDRSSSMSADRSNFGDVRTRLDWAKAGARAFADLQAGSGVEVGLTTFQSFPVSELDLRPIEPDASATSSDHGLTAFKNRVDAQVAGGGTAIGDTLELARQELNAESASNPTLQQAIFLLTDGEQTTGTLDPQDVATALRADGIQIFAVPLGSLTDSEFLSRMADETGGAMLESASGLELPTLYAELYARFRGEAPVLPRTPSAVRGQGPVIQAVGVTGSDPGPSGPLPESETFIIPVETDADRLNLILSTRNDVAGTWNPAFRLEGPAGEVITHRSGGVIGDDFYRIVRVANPTAGDWRVTLSAQSAADQLSYLLGHVEDPRPDCYAGVSPRTVVDGSRPLEITAAASLGAPLGKGVVYTATVRRPSGSTVVVPMTLVESQQGASGLFNGFLGRGLYEVVVECRATAAARYAPGERATPEEILALPRPEPFVRQARTSFFVDSGDLPPSDGDCDDDGIPDSIEGQLDSDGDGLPDACDEDSDADEVPDNKEGDGAPLEDVDGDGIVNMRDPDANNNGIIDGLDPDPYTVVRPGGGFDDRRFGYSFHIGSAHPLGDFDERADANIYVQADLSYRLLDHVDLVGRIGLAQFTEDVSADFDNPYWLHSSANLLRLFPTSTGLSWYVQGGLGWYVPENGSNELGFNLGFGARLPLQAPFALEIGTDYHNIQTDESTEFFTVQLGVLFR